MADKKGVADLASTKKDAEGRRSRSSSSQSWDLSSDDSDSNRQSLYVGGSEHSGQQVLGPERDAHRDYVSRVFEAARHHGAEVMNPDEGQSAGAAGGATHQVITGYRLGDAVRPSEAVHEADNSKGGPSRLPQKKVKLVMWSKGFTVDDGPFREFRDASNKAFMDSVMAGRIPVELQHAHPGHEIDLRMERKEGEYKPPPAHPFAGAGHRLGEIVPTVVGAGAIGQKADTSSAPKAASEEDKGALSQERGQAEIKLKDGEPVTQVQLRFPDGQRITGRFNHSHTIRDIRVFIIGASPLMAFEPFNLMNSYPSRCLDEENSTIKELGLLNSLLIVKLVH